MIVYVAVATAGQEALLLMAMTVKADIDAYALKCALRRSVFHEFCSIRFLADMLYSINTQPRTYEY